MRLATYINLNEQILFGTVIRSKEPPRDALLIAIENRVNLAYEVYCNSFNLLQNQTRSVILRSEAPEKEALIHCYESPPQNFKNVRGLIKSTQVGILKIWCPYCLLNASDTLDHYIPKNQFPEFSILAKNLIPCCTQCNKKKDEAWRQGRQRRFLHFYNDTFLQHRFLFGKITISRATNLPIINFYLRRPAALTAYQFSIIKFHFKDLDLITQYNSRVNSVISTHVQLIESVVANGVNSVLDIQAVLIENYNSKSAIFGPNFYEAIVFEAFSQNMRFLRSFF